MADDAGVLPQPGGKLRAIDAVAGDGRCDLFRTCRIPEVCGRAAVIEVNLPKSHKTTIYTHGVNVGERSVRSPADDVDRARLELRCQGWIPQ